MDEEIRWASPVHVPRPPLEPRRRFSIPAALYSTKTDLQLDEKSGLLSNAQTDYDNQLQRCANGTGRKALWWADSIHDCPTREPAHEEIKPEEADECRNQRHSLAKSFSNVDLVPGESLGKHNPTTCHRPVSSTTGYSRPGHDADNSPLYSDTGLHRPRMVMHLAGGTLPGARERKRPILLKQRERTPALNIDDSALLLAHHVPSSSSSSPSLSDTSATRTENRSTHTHTHTHTHSLPPRSSFPEYAQGLVPGSSSSASLHTSPSTPLR